MMTAPPVTPSEYLQALCIWREARSEGREGMAAVLAVIRGRMADPRWPSSAEGVVLQKFQFSCMNAGDPQVVRFPRPDVGGLEWDLFVEAVGLVRGGARAGEVAGVGVGAGAGAGAGEVGQGGPQAGGPQPGIPQPGTTVAVAVNHYYDTSIPPPVWAKGKEPVLSIGKLRFFRL